MVFNSLTFVFFIPIVIFVYYLLPKHRYRQIFLLLASAVFYSILVPEYLFIIIGLTTIDYFVAKAISRDSVVNKKKYLALSVLASLTVLFLFKYFNFFAESIESISALLNWNYSHEVLAIIVPLGLSFHVFQSLSYVIEVYRGRYKVEKDYISYLLYVMFFPQLVAGPIERPGHLLPQLKIRHQFNKETFVSGLELFIWGFIKKLVVADRLSYFVDPVYANVGDASGISLFVAVFLFTFQLYFDFSGYVDIGRGCAKMLGIELTSNFNNPFLSRSHAEFWRRWHMSLSGWFRDYVYMGIARSKASLGKKWIYASIIITFLLTGIWHGAGWTFAFMGLLSGLYIVIGASTQKVRKKIVSFIYLDKNPRLHTLIQILITFSMVNILWIFFRSQSLSDAFYVFSHFLMWGDFIENFFVWSYWEDNIFMGYQAVEFYIAVTFAAIMIGVEASQKEADIRHFFATKSFYTRSVLQMVSILTLIVYGIFKSQQFIYFQF